MTLIRRTALLLVTVLLLAALGGISSEAPSFWNVLFSGFYLMFELLVQVVMVVAVVVCVLYFFGVFRPRT
jgi:hypothetical protein